MGVCGAAQICRSKDNPQASNMQQRPKSLSSVKDVGFEYDKRQKQCKAVSDSDSSDIHPPISNNNKSSSHTRDDKTTATVTQPTVVTVPALSNSRNSRKLNDTTTPSTPCTPSPEPQPQPPPKAKPAVIINRKSQTYIPLNDEDTMQPTTTTQPPHPPPTDINNNTNHTAFMRQRSAGRQRASSEDIMTAAEHALLEDSRTINKIFVDEYIYNPGLVTPVATPSTNLKPRTVNINTNLPSTSPGKQKQNVGSPAFSINSVHSQSSATDTYNTRQTHEMQNCDNININNIYAVTRAPNLSLSNVGNLLLPGVDGQFPQRISSTSSEWAHLVEQERANSGGGGGVFDSEDYIQWRFSRGASVNNGVHNGGNVGSVSSVAIDRIDVSRDQSLTDL